MNAVYYAHPTGQYVGAIVTEDEINLDSNYFADIGCFVVPSAPESTQWFWEFEKKAWYLPEKSPEELASEERRWRDDALESVVWMRERHRDQVEIGDGTTLSADQFKELLIYVQALRDWPQSSLFPDSSKRPSAPSWITE